MKILPTIYVVLETSGDKWHIFNVELVAWFFNESEAEDWADVRRPGRNLRVEAVPGGKW